MRPVSVVFRADGAFRLLSAIWKESRVTRSRRYVLAVLDRLRVAARCLSFE